MAGAQIPSSVTILNSLKGFQGISLTEFATSALSQIAAGSVVEIAGAFFNFPADETINASTWTSITSGNTAYIALVPAGTAGSQTVTAEYTATAPVWRDDMQGWYASAASITRVVASVYKVSATAQTQKYLYSPLQDAKQRNISVLSASVASSLSVAGAISASSSLSVAGAIYDKNGQEVLALRATTESFLKFMTSGTITTLTTISGVKALTYLSARYTGSSTLNVYASVNSGVISVYNPASITENLTFTASYLY